VWREAIEEEGALPRQVEKAKEMIPKLIFEKKRDFSGLISGILYVGEQGEATTGYS